MKKPLNRWAIVMWVAAALVVVEQIVHVLTINWPPENATYVFSIVIDAIHFTTFYATMLVGLGVVIQMVDQKSRDGGG